MKRMRFNTLYNNGGLDFNEGDVVYVGGHPSSYNVEQKKPVLDTDRLLISRDRRSSRYMSQSVPKFVLGPLLFPVDIELTEIKVGDEIARMNSTDNLNIMERRKVIAVSPESITMAPKMEGGRVTTTGDFDNVLLIKRG